jgi:hypothetical protein
MYRYTSVIHSLYYKACITQVIIVGTALTAQTSFEATNIHTLYHFTVYNRCITFVLFRLLYCRYTLHYIITKV